MPFFRANGGRLRERIIILTMCSYTLEEHLECKLIEVGRKEVTSQQLQFMGLCSYYRRGLQAALLAFKELRKRLCESPIRQTICVGD